MALKQVPLHSKHIQAGARMVSFAGFEMPLHYSSVMEEHQEVRKNVGVFDVSHMGEFLIKGKFALDLVQYVTTNDASKLSVGQTQYSCLPNEGGGIVDDLLVYRIKEEEYMMVVNASNIEKDWDWINKHNKFEAELENISDRITLLAVQGPNATAVLQKITSLDLDSMKPFTFDTGNISDVTDGVIFSATGYTGAGGFELYMYNEYAEAAWDRIFQAGRDQGIKAVGLAARDTLRLEKGLCLYGNDIDDTTSPIEAGLGWITKFSKDFINAEELKKQKEEGVDRHLVGFKMIERGVPRHGYEILNDKKEKIGHVTSGTMSPSMGIGIGMGYVTTENKNPGTEILIPIRNKKLKAEVVKQPIYKE